MSPRLRPIVLLSTIAVVQAFITLCYPSKFVITAVISFFIAILFFLAFLKSRKYTLGILFFAIIIFGSVNPIISYTKSQKSAEDFTQAHAFTTDSVFSAQVYDCKNYTGFSVIDAYLLEYDGNILKDRNKCRINCYTSESYKKGDIVTFSGIPQKSSEVKSDNFDTAGYLKSKGIFINFNNSVLLSSKINEQSTLLEKLKDHTRTSIYRYIKQGFDFTSSSICFALISGDKDFIDENLKSTFSKSGTTHLLCVSGMHLSVILGTLYALFSLLTIHKRTKTVFVIIIGFLYTLFSGFALSTLRAAIISTITFTADFLGKKTDAFKSLFFTLLVIVLAFPYSVFDISARLSFCATLGILSFSCLLPKIKEKGIFSKALNTVISCISCNVGAVVFTLPVACYTFSGFSTVSAISTLLVSFVFQILLISVLMLLLLSSLSGFGLFELICHSLGKMCSYLCTYTVNVCEYFASLKYSYISSHQNEIVFIFIFLLLLYVLFVFANLKTAQKFITLLTLFSVICFTFFSLYSAIKEDYEYKVIYYRKNENDRQLSIKLANKGYLLVNADNRLCTDKDFEGFDTKAQNNYLLIIPDDIITPSVLIQNIKEFDRRYGLKEIFLPDNKDAISLSQEFEKHNIDYTVFPKSLNYGKFIIELSCNEFYRINVSDKNNKTSVVFADSYDSNYFEKDTDICAYFTRKTKNQFDIQKDTVNDWCIFFTRLAKGMEYDGIINTYGQKIFYIKE